MDDRLQILNEYDETLDLESACRRTGTTAQCHDDERRQPEDASPKLIVVVFALESAGRDDGGDMEEGGSDPVGKAHGHGFDLFGRQGRLRRSNIEEEEEEQRESKDDVEEPSQFLVAPELAEVPMAHHVIEREVDAGDDEEERTDKLDEGGMIPAEARLMGGEAARGEGGHGVVDGIEKGHAALQIEHGTEEGQSDIDEPQGTRSVLDARMQFLEADARHLGAEHLDGTWFDARKHGQREDHDAETAHPLGEAAPIEDAMRLGVNIVEDGTSRGRKPRHRLQEGIAKAVACAREQIGNHADEREDDPHARDDEQTLALGHAQRQERAPLQQAVSQEGTKDRGHQKRQEIPLAQLEIVIERDATGREQEQRLEQQELAASMSDKRPVDGCHAHGRSFLISY